MENNIELIYNIMNEHGLVQFQQGLPIDKIERAMVAFAERFAQQQTQKAQKARRLLEKLKTPFLRWDDQSQPEFVNIMHSEVLPFLAEEEAVSIV